MTFKYVYLEKKGYFLIFINKPFFLVFMKNSNHKSVSKIFNYRENYMRYIGNNK